MNTIHHFPLLTGMPLRILRAMATNNYTVETIKTHDHPFFQLEVITAGQTVMEFDGRRRVVSRGLASFFRPFHPHGEAAQKTTGRASNIHLKFEADFAWSSLLNLAPVQRFYHVKQLRAVVRLWNGAAASDKIKAHLQLALLFLEIAADRRYRKISLPTGSRHPWLEHAIQFIHGHLASRLTVAEMARQAHMSRDYFSRCFHNKVGVPPIRYLQQARIARAKAMLNQGATCKEAAFSLAFPSVAYFSRVFKHICGIAPSQWMKTINLRG